MISNNLNVSIKKLSNEEKTVFYVQEIMKKEMKRRFLSERTIESYLFCLGKFLRHCNKDPRKITKKDIQDYLDNLIARNKAGSTLNIHYSSIKFLLKDVLNRNIELNKKFSRRPKSLPTVLTKEEVILLFNSINNQKHKLMIELIYSAGLRVSELLNLRVQDLDSNAGWVRQGKGNKDRPFILAERIKDRLAQQIRNKQPNDYIFQGWNGRMHPSTVRGILKKANKKAKIKKNIHPHTLRHSFATHLIENEYTPTDIQPLLGHNSLQTTNIYIHTAKKHLINIKSPYDDF